MDAIHCVVTESYVISTTAVGTFITNKTYLHI